MNSLGTYEIDKIQLQQNAEKLWSDTKKLENDIEKIKQMSLANSNNTIKLCIETLETTAIPILKHYSQVMEKISIQTQEVGSKTVE